MAIAGYAIGGAASSGPTALFKNLPFQNWQDQQNWINEWIDALGIMMDVYYQRYVAPAAKADLINPATTPSVDATNYLATKTEAPASSAVTDTMLDLLCYVCGFPTPVDSGLTIEDKQALASLTQDVLKFKGTRQRLLSVVASVTKSVYGWTPNAFNFGILLGDGQPNPGWGDWVSDGYSTKRPWLFQALRNLLANLCPAWTELGIGYSMFRADFSAAGEIVGGVGTSSDPSLNILQNEHFNKWSGSIPTGYNTSGTIHKVTSDGYINYEFFTSDGFQPCVAQIDMTSAAIGSTASISQQAFYLNNQIEHHVEIDYAYTSPQSIESLSCTIFDPSNTQYWNGASWQTSIYKFVLPPSAVRTRFSVDVVPVTATAVNLGMSFLTVKVSAIYDGTATTQIKYNLYRFGFYENYSEELEASALGDRLSWYPLVDALGYTTGSRNAGTGNDYIVEPANADYSIVKFQPDTQLTFPYHPALGGRGYLSTGYNWKNLIEYSNTVTQSPWQLLNASAIQNIIYSPLGGETSPTATLLIKSSLSGQIQQIIQGSPTVTNHSFIAGGWFRSISSSPTDLTITLSASSGKSLRQTFTISSTKWTYVSTAAFTFGPSDTGSLIMSIGWAAASSTAPMSAFCTFLYDTTGHKNVKNPPVIVTTGTQDSVAPAQLQAVTDSTGSNVLHPYLKRPLISVNNGALNMTVVPMFDGDSQPDGYLFDVAATSVRDRFSIAVKSGNLVFSYRDDTGTYPARIVSFALTSSIDPSANALTWRRDQALSIRAIFIQSSLYVSAGNSSGQQSVNAWTSCDDTQLKALYIGSDFTGNNPFDGILTDVEILQVGSGFI